MRKIPLSLLFLAVQAHAIDATNTPWSSGTVQMKRGIVPIGAPYATKALCQAAAKAAVIAYGKSTPITCDDPSTSLFTVVADPPPPPAPAPAYVNPFVPVDAAKVAAVNASYGVGTAFRNPTNGWSQPMLIATTEVAPPSDIGAFRTGCQVVKHGFFDPIVSPGLDNSSHLHVFVGNMGINPSSTSASIASTGNSTCRIGTANRSSYWLPSAIDMRTGAPITPMFEQNLYYKSGTAINPQTIVDLPQGLRMISGNSRGTPSNPSGVNPGFACAWNGGNTNWQSTIPKSCTVSGVSWLIMGVDFPQCWNGELDSPDHSSHMTNPIGGGPNHDDFANGHQVCPPSHPFTLPQIAYQFLYRYDQDPALLANMRLSSDNYPTTFPAGYSLHGDYIMGWGNDAQGNPVVPVWTQKCDREKKDCHSHLLGDGRAMVIP